jgi:hypothetical protein
MMALQVFSAARLEYVPESKLVLDRGLPGRINPAGIESDRQTPVDG